MLVGRKEEQKTLRMALETDESQLIAVYGRRRVGKTFLIRETFGNNFCFQFTGAPKMKARQQLARFRLALKNHGLKDVQPISNWMYAFSELARFIKMQPYNKVNKQELRNLILLNIAKNE